MPQNKFKEGDKVRDRANLGGVVLETWGNGVKVRWNTLFVDYIDERFLSLDEPTYAPQPLKE